MAPIRPSTGRSTTEHPATSTGEAPVSSTPTPTVRTPPTRDAARDSVDLVLTEASRRGSADTTGRTLGPRERFTAELTHYRALRDTNPTEARRIMREVLPDLAREISDHLRSSPGDCLEDMRMLRSYRRDAIDWQNANRPSRSLTDSREYDAHEARTAELERALNSTNASMRLLRDHLRGTFYVPPGGHPTADQIRCARFCAEISHELGEYAYLRDDLRTWGRLMRASGAETLSTEEAGSQALALLQGWSVLRDAATGRIERDSNAAPLGMTADEITVEMRSVVREVLVDRLELEGTGRDSVENYLNQLVDSNESRRIDELTLANLGTYAESSAAMQATINRANAATDPGARRPILLTALREAVALGSDSDIRRIRDMLNATLPEAGFPGRDAIRLEMLIAEHTAIAGHDLNSEALVRTEIEGLCAEITARETALLTPDDRTGHPLPSTHVPSGTTTELAGRARALTLAHSYYLSVGDAQAGLMFPSLRRVRTELRASIRDHAAMSPTDYASASRSLAELSLSMTDSRDVEIRFRTNEIYERLIAEAGTRGEDVSWSHSQRTIREHARELALHEYSANLRHDLDRWLVSVGRLRTATPPVEMGVRLEHLRAAATTVRMLRTIREGDAPLIETSLIEERVRIVEGQLTAFFEDGLRQPADAPMAQRNLADAIVYDLRTRVHFGMAENASPTEVAWLSSLTPASVRSFAETSQAAHLLTADAPHDPPTTEELQAILQATQLYASLGLNNRVRETVGPLTHFAYGLDATDPAAAAQRANLLLVVSQIYSQAGSMDAEVRSALEGVVALDRPGELHDTAVLARAMLAMQRGDLTAAQEFLLTIPDHPMAATFIEGIRSGQRAQRIAQIVGVLRAVSLNYIERGREAGEDMGAIERDTMGGWREVQRLMISGECANVDSAVTRMLESRRFPNFTSGTGEFHIGSNVGAFISTVSNPAISEAQFHDAVFELCGYLRMDDYFMAASQIYQTMEGDPRLSARAREHLDSIPGEMRFHSGLNVARTLMALRAGPAGMIGMSMTSGGSPDEMVEGVAMTVVPFAIARVAAVGAEGLFVARATGGTIRVVRGGEVVVAAGSRTVSGLGAMRFGVRSVTEATVFTASSMGMHSLFTGRTDNWTYSNFGTEFGTMLLTFGLCHGVGLGVRGLGRTAARVESFRAPGMSAELGEAALRPGVRRAVGVVGYAGTIGSLTGLEYFNEATGLHHSDGDVPFYLRLMSSALTDASMRAAGSRIDAISGGRIATFESSINHAEMVHDLVPVLERMGYERPTRTGELSPEATVVLHTMMARVAAGESVRAVADSMDSATAERYRDVVRDNLGVDPNTAEGRQAMALLYSYVHNGRTPAEARAMGAHLAENVAAIRRSADSFLSEAGIEAGPTRRHLENLILRDALIHGRSAAEVSSLATHSTEFGDRLRSIVNGVLGPRDRSTPEGQELMAALITRALSAEHFSDPTASLEAVADALPQITAAMTRAFEGLGDVPPAVRRGLASLVLLRAMREGGTNSGAIAHEVEAFANNASGINEAITNLARMLGFGGAQARVDLLAWAIRDGITPGALRGIASRVAEGANTITIDAETGRVTVNTVAAGDRAAARDAVNERMEPPAGERRGTRGTESAVEEPPVVAAAALSSGAPSLVVDVPRPPSPAELLPQVRLLSRIRSAASFSGTVEPSYLRAILNMVRSGELVLTEEMATRMETIFADPRTDAALDQAHPMQADRVRSALITEIIRGRVTSAENIGATVRAIIERPTSFEGYSLGRGRIPERVASRPGLPAIEPSSEGFAVLDRFSFTHGTETGVIHTTRDGRRGFWSHHRIVLESLADPGMPPGPLASSARRTRAALGIAYERAEEIQRLSASEPTSPRLEEARRELAEATRTLEAWENNFNVWQRALDQGAVLEATASTPFRRLYAALEPSVHEYDADGSPLSARPRETALSAVADRIVTVRHDSADSYTLADAWLDPARGDQGDNPVDAGEIDMVVRSRSDIGVVADAAVTRIRESGAFRDVAPEISRSVGPDGTVLITVTRPDNPNLRNRVRVLEAGVERAERVAADAAFERAVTEVPASAELPTLRIAIPSPEVAARREARTMRPPRPAGGDAEGTAANTPRSLSREAEPPPADLTEPSGRTGRWPGEGLPNEFNAGGTSYSVASSRVEGLADGTLGVGEVLFTLAQAPRTAEPHFAADLAATREFLRQNAVPPPYRFIYAGPAGDRYIAVEFGEAGARYRVSLRRPAEGAEVSGSPVSSPVIANGELRVDLSGARSPFQTVSLPSGGGLRFALGAGGAIAVFNLTNRPFTVVRSSARLAEIREIASRETDPAERDAILNDPAHAPRTEVAADAGGDHPGRTEIGPGDVIRFADGSELVFQPTLPSEAAPVAEVPNETVRITAPARPPAEARPTRPVRAPRGGTGEAVGEASVVPVDRPPPADLLAMVGESEPGETAEPIPSESGVRRTDRPRAEAVEEPATATGTEGADRTTVRPGPARPERTSEPAPAVVSARETIARGRRLADSDSPIARHARAAMERLGNAREGTPEFNAALAEVNTLTDMTLAAALPLPPRDHPRYHEALGLRSLARGAITSMGRAEPGSGEYTRSLEGYRRGRESIVRQLVEGGHTTAENVLNYLTEIGGGEVAAPRPEPAAVEVAPAVAADPFAGLPTEGATGEAVTRGRRLATSESPLARYARAALQRLSGATAGTPEFRAALAEVETLTEMANAAALRIPERGHPNHQAALEFRAFASGAISSLARIEPGSAEYTSGLDSYRRGRDAIAHRLVEAHRPAMENVLNFLTEIGAGGEAWNEVHDRFPFLEAPHLSEGIAPHGRLKAESDVLAKLNRRGWTSLDTMTDFAGTRAVVDGYEDVTSLVAAIQSRYTVREVRDAEGNVVSGRDRDGMRRLLEGARSGYRAIHVVVEIDGRPVEIQVQTRAMYEWGRIQHGMIYSEVRGTGSGAAATSSYTLSGAARTAADAYCREVASYLSDVEVGATLAARPSSDAVVRALPRDMPAEARESVIAELNAMDDLMTSTVARLRPSPAEAAAEPVAEVIDLFAHRRRSDAPPAMDLVSEAAGTELSEPATVVAAPRPLHSPFPAGPEGAAARQRFARALEAQLGSRLAGLMEESEVTAARAYIAAVGRGEEPSPEITAGALEAFSYHVIHTSDRVDAEGRPIRITDTIRLPTEPPAEGSLFRATVLAVDEAAGTIRIRRANGAEITLTTYIPGPSPFRPDQVVLYIPAISGASGAPPFTITEPAAAGTAGEIRPSRGTSEFRVGRSHGSSDPRMSRDHAVFRRGSDGRWTVEDLGSMNGVFALGLDGRPFRIAPNSPLPLVDGSELVIGSHRYTFRPPVEAGRVLPVAEMNPGVPEAPVVAPPVGGSRFTLNGITVERAGDHWYAMSGETPVRINGSSRRGTNPLNAGDLIEIGGRSFRFQPEVEIHTYGSDIAEVSLPGRHRSDRPLNHIVTGGRLSADGRSVEVSLSRLRGASQVAEILRMPREVAERLGFRFSADGAISRRESPGELALEEALPPAPVYAAPAVHTHEAPPVGDGAYRSTVPRVDVPVPVDEAGNRYSISGDPTMVASAGMFGGPAFVGHPVRTDIHPDGTAFVTFLGRLTGETVERRFVLRMNTEAARDLGLSRGDAPARDYRILMTGGPRRAETESREALPPSAPLPPPIRATGSDGTAFEFRPDSPGEFHGGGMMRPDYFGSNARIVSLNTNSVRISAEVRDVSTSGVSSPRRVEMTLPRERAVALHILRSDGTLVSDTLAMFRPEGSGASSSGSVPMGAAPLPPPPPGSVRFPSGGAPREFSFGRTTAGNAPDITVGDDMRMIGRRQAIFRLENGLLSVRAEAREGTWYLNGSTWYEITPERGPVLLPEGTRIAFGRPADVDGRTSPRTAPYRAEGTPDLIPIEVRANGELRAAPESGLRFSTREAAAPVASGTSAASLPLSSEPREVILDNGLRLALPLPEGISGRRREVSMPSYIINEAAIVSSDSETLTIRGNFTNITNVMNSDASTEPVTFRITRSAASALRIVGPDGRLTSASLTLSRSTALPAELTTRLGLPTRRGPEGPIVDLAALPDLSPRGGADPAWREHPAEDLTGIAAGSNEGVGYSDHNEDRYVVARRPDGSIATVVIDGMGGMGGGERASSIARSVIREAISRGATIEEALDLANAAITQENAETRGRGGAVAVGMEVRPSADGRYDVSMRRVGDSDAAAFDLSEGAATPILGRTERHAAGATLNIRLNSTSAVATCLGIDGARSVIENTELRVGRGSVLLAGSDGFWENFSDYAEVRELMMSSSDRSAEGLRSTLMTEVRVRQTLLEMRNAAGPGRWLITPERYREAYRTATGREAPAEISRRYIGAELREDARVVDSNGRGIGRFKADNVTLVVQVVGEGVEPRTPAVAADPVPRTGGARRGPPPIPPAARPAAPAPIVAPLSAAAREPGGAASVPSLLVVGVPAASGRGSGSEHPYRVAGPETSGGNNIYRLTLDESRAPGHVPTAVEVRSPTPLDASALEGSLSPRRRESGVEVRATYGDLIPLADMPNGGGAAPMVDFYVVSEEAAMNSVSSPGTPSVAIVDPLASAAAGSPIFALQRRGSGYRLILQSEGVTIRDASGAARPPVRDNPRAFDLVVGDRVRFGMTELTFDGSSFRLPSDVSTEARLRVPAGAL